MDKIQHEQIDFVHVLAGTSARQNSHLNLNLGPNIMLKQSQ